MHHFFAAGITVWLCRIVFFALLYLLSPSAIDAFLMASAFLLLDFTLCSRLTRARIASNLMSRWRAASLEDQCADSSPEDRYKH